MEELAHEDAQKYMGYWYERAVDEQKKELKDYKKKLKTQEVLPQLPLIELIPALEKRDENSSQGQENGPEPEEA